MVYLGEIPPDDIDSYTNKRCCTTGLQFALLIRQLIRNFIKVLHVQVFKAVNINKNIKNPHSNFASLHFIYCIHFLLHFFYLFTVR
jgi:DNA-directed RNA polymerase beta subunit